MKLKTLRDIDIKGKTVLLRVDYNVKPVEENDSWIVKNTTRLEATIPTLKYLLDMECKIAILTYVGRPEGKVVEKLSTIYHAKVLSELIGKEVKHIEDCIGYEIKKAIRDLGNGELLMLENTRFHPEEDATDEGFTKELAQDFDICVFDAFGQAHRKHASTTGILKELPSVAGFLMEKEIEAYDRILENPVRPIVAILGGAKISDKLDTLRNLLSKVDLVLIGGALANTFLKGQNIPVGASLVETAVVDKQQKELDLPALAAELIKTAPVVEGTHMWPIEASTKLVLPVDLLAASDTNETAETKVISVDDHETIPDTWKFLDIGPATIDFYENIIEKAKTVFWNGPMGFFEIDAFGKGTKKISDAVISSPAYSIVAGGDTETIISKYGLEGKFSHVSTGGGVSLRILAGKELPVVEYLKK